MAPRYRGSPACMVTHGPEGHASYSSNWAGDVDTSLPSYTSVSASWTQPDLTGTTVSAAAFWVGFDGWTGAGANIVEQCGTQVYNNSGTYIHNAWTEFYPALSEDWSPALEYPVAAGDQITASLTWDGTWFNVTMSDSTQGWTYTEKKGLVAAEIELGQAGTPPARTSAQVIAENFTGTLADFGSVTFTSVSGLPSPTGIICTNNGLSSGTVDMTPGTLSGGQFTVTWEAAG